MWRRTCALRDGERAVPTGDSAVFPPSGRRLERRYGRTRRQHGARGGRSNEDFRSGNDEKAKWEFLAILTTTISEIIQRRRE